MKNWMEKAASPSTTHSMETCGDLQCVGTLEIVRPKPVGFLCGSIPVPTDNSFHSFNSSALLPSTQTVSAPRYRMLPTETDLNALPAVSNLPDKVLPIVAAHSKPAGELAWETDAVSSNLRRRCEALAVTGLVEYGDEIDVIAPADIVKQIFKMPYSKARLSIAVRRIGQTLVLNTGPDPEEGEKLVRRHNNQPKCADQTLFLNFAMHSVRMEACDCPPTHHASSEGQSNSSFLPGATMSPFVGNSDEVTSDGAFSQSSDYAQLKEDEIFWKKKKNRNNGHHSIKKTSYVGEKPRCSMQESEKHKRVSDDGFLRVLFWQFHNFRMLLGSDLLLFSNDKYVSVSLHLWDVTRQVTPLNWLEAWLDNVMASVPELAICYHQDGVVQGYELLKTDDIFLLKGISEDGTPAFHPFFVQQNGLSVLRFLQENCKQDPGAYWLYKSAGEDVIQLFDLSVIPKTHDSNEREDSSSTQPSLRHRARSDSFFSLGTLLYRIAHKLSLSMAPNNREKCASFFRKCLEFLDEPDHLVVRAFAHEQFARLLLNHDQELELTSDSLPLECEAMVSVDSLEHFSSSEAVFGENVSLSVAEDHLSGDGRRFYDVPFEPSVGMTLEVNVSSTRNSTSDDEDIKPTGNMQNSSEPLAVCKISSMPTQMVQSVSDPIFSKLAAVHHVSQAIKSLRWMRQLQTSEELLDHDGSLDIPPSNLKFSVCACGDADCIQVCDIKEWLPTSKIDHRLWKLVLLLGESYLALAQAYMEDKQLHQVLKVVEVACSVYGSMPQYFEDARYISSIVKYKFSREYTERNEMKKSYTTDLKDVKSSSEDDFPSFEHFSSTYLFWARAWTLVGDVHIEFHFIEGKEPILQTEGKYSPRDLKMSFEVLKEVQRLKKKLGQYNRNCSSCSLANCSCQSDRASSGTSASCSSGDSVPYSRKHVKRYSSKVTSYSSLGDSDDSQSHPKLDNRNISETDGPQFGINCDNPLNSRVSRDNGTGCSVTTASYTELMVSLNNRDTGSTTSCVIKTASKEGTTSKKGGIFKYLREPVLGDAEDNLSAALTCYEKARKALHGLPTASLELQCVIKKIGWVCNEMGRNRLERKELNKAQHAFAQAISAFREVSDHTNIILIYCNLGHGRRALAEEMVSKIDNLKQHPIFHDAYNQAVESAKIEYSEALKYYGAAKSELNNVEQKVDGVPTGLRNEVYTQFAHTFLKLGMLLATEDLTADVYEKEAMGDNSLVDVSSTDKKTRKELRKYEISANDAIREALSVYESLGDLRQQEAAYAYYQLACHQRDCCLKFLELDCKKSSLPKSESSIVTRVKQYAYLAERNWQKALEFYGPETHPSMYLTIVMERSALLLSLSSALHSNPMLESALFRMLGGRHMPETILASFETEYPEVCARFWGQLQMLLKKLLSQTLNVNTNKSPANSQQATGSSKCRDVGKLRELYKMSLKSKNLSQLHDMHVLWTSSEIGHSFP